MECHLLHAACEGAVSNYSFVWHFVPHERDRNRFQAGDTVLTCHLCVNHYQLLLEGNNGIVPEITASSRLAALENLTLFLQSYDEMDAEILECQHCYEETDEICERCYDPICGSCRNIHFCR